MILKQFELGSVVDADREASSFCYLLLDPSKLPNKKTCTMKEFLIALFYVGQGKRSRPLKHLRVPSKHRKNENYVKVI